MTSDEVLRMAREAGLHLATDVHWMPIIGLDYAQDFAAIVAAAEREACAAFLEGYAKRFDDIRSAALEMAAENIRARGMK